MSNTLKLLLRKKQFELFEDNMNYALKVVSTISIPTFCEYEDILQCAFIGLWRSIKNYDPTIASLSTYAYYKIKQEIWHYIRYEYKLRGYPSRKEVKAKGYEVYNYEDSIWFNIPDGDSNNFEHEVLDKVIVEDILRKLPYHKRSLLKKRYGIDCQPLKLKELGVIYNKTPYAVNTELKRLKRMLERKYRRYMR